MHAAHLLRDRAALTPDHEALLELATGRRFSYAELDARANRAAHLLRTAFGVRAGDRVAVLAHNSAAFVELFFAAGKLGAILVPLNWRLAAAELAYMLADCTPVLLACGAGTSDSRTSSHGSPSCRRCSRSTALTCRHRATRPSSRARRTAHPRRRR